MSKRDEDVISRFIADIERIWGPGWELVHATKIDDHGKNCADGDNHDTMQRGNSRRDHPRGGKITRPSLGSRP